MSVVGLITEYNPFHNGHSYHIKESKKLTKSDDLILVMSGNYVQRGEPAIVDKWTRTKIALENGADLVIELPTIFATSSAEFFAHASVSLLESTGLVDTLCFGSEVGKIKPLNKIATALVKESPSFQYCLKKYLAEGKSYPLAREKALIDTLKFVPKGVIQSPNNILGIEYLKSLQKLDSTIKPFTIKRVGSSYHDLSIDTQFSSASAIRQLLNEDINNKISKYMPSSASNLLYSAIVNQSAPIFMDDIYSFLKYRIQMLNTRELSSILDISEGMENRVITAINKANSMQELKDLLATKRYTNTRLSRALIHLLLDIEKNDFNTYIQGGYNQYIKVLGFNGKKQHLMKGLKEKSTLPLIVNVRDAMNSLNYLPKKMLQQEINYTNIYNTIIYNKFSTTMKNEFTQPIIIYK